MTIRLNKLLARRGLGARRKCDALIQDGQVRVNGRVVREPGTMVEEDKDRVEVNGRGLPPRAQHRYFVLNKPVGVISTLSDPEGRRTIREFLPAGGRLYPVGRLDADTSGLLVLTNDGELAHRLMHPRYGVEKVYRVWLDRAPSDGQLARLRNGVEFEPGVVSARARVKPLEAGRGEGLIELAIHEGRYRQVRRMCEAVGLHVTGLHRWAYGPIKLGPIERGMWRELSSEEVALLRGSSARPVRGGGRTGEFFSARRGLVRSDAAPAERERREGAGHGRRAGARLAREREGQAGGGAPDTRAPRGPRPRRDDAAPRADARADRERRGRFGTPAPGTGSGGRHRFERVPGEPARRAEPPRDDAGGEEFEVRRFAGAREEIDAPRERGERVSRERTARATRPERGDRAPRPARGVRTERSDRTSRPERGFRAERSERAPRPGFRAERSDRAPRPGSRSERSDRAPRPERGFRAERSDRAPRPERGFRSERSDRAPRPERGFRSERSDRAPRPERGFRAERSDRAPRPGVRSERPDRFARGGRDAARPSRSDRGPASGGRFERGARPAARTPRDAGPRPFARFERAPRDRGAGAAGRFERGAADSPRERERPRRDAAGVRRFERAERAPRDPGLRERVQDPRDRSERGRPSRGAGAPGARRPSGPRGTAAGERGDRSRARRDAPVGQAPRRGVGRRNDRGPAGPRSRRPTR